MHRNLVHLETNLLSIPGLSTIPVKMTEVVINDGDLVGLKGKVVIVTGMCETPVTAWRLIECLCSYYSVPFGLLSLQAYMPPMARFG